MVTQAAVGGERMVTIDDTILTGRPTLTMDCDGCQRRSFFALKIATIRLPEGIKAGKTLIGYRLNTKAELKAPEVLGIDCGCYARFHRQIAHIKDKVKT